MRKAITVAQALLCLACGASTDTPLGVGSTIDGRVVHPDVVTVTVTPLDSVVVAGGKLQYVGIARDGQGRVLRAGSWTWQSSDTTIAVVSQAGVVTTRREGHVNIVATAFPPWKR
jgi:hypothetical protein